MIFSTPSNPTCLFEGYCVLSFSLLSVFVSRDLFSRDFTPQDPYSQAALLLRKTADKKEIMESFC